MINNLQITFFNVKFRSLDYTANFIFKKVICELLIVVIILKSNFF